MEMGPSWGGCRRLHASLETTNTKWSAHYRCRIPAIIDPSFCLEKRTHSRVPGLSRPARRRSTPVGDMSHKGPVRRFELWTSRLCPKSSTTLQLVFLNLRRPVPKAELRSVRKLTSIVETVSQQSCTSRQEASQASACRHTLMAKSHAEGCTLHRHDAKRPDTYPNSEKGPNTIPKHRLSTRNLQQACEQFTLKSATRSSESCS